MLDFNHKVAGDGRGWSTALPRKTCGRPEGKPSPKAITYTLMKLLRVKLFLRRKVLDITTICLENGCRNMQKNVIFNLYLTINSKVQKKKKNLISLVTIVLKKKF